jgi:integrase
MAGGSCSRSAGKPAAGVVKNRKPLIVPLSELTAMLKKKFPGYGTVFPTKNFRREWIKACVKCGLGEKKGKAQHQYRSLVPHDFRRSAVRNLVNSRVDTATAMKITRHRTLRIFMRYNVILMVQIHEAVEKVTSKGRRQSEAEQRKYNAKLGCDSGQSELSSFLSMRGP